MFDNLKALPGFEQVLASMGVLHARNSRALLDVITLIILWLLLPDQRHIQAYKRAVELPQIRYEAVGGRAGAQEKALQYFQLTWGEWQLQAELRAEGD